MSDEHTKAVLEKMEAARRFPHNTCPASRHVELMALALAKEGQFPGFEDDPDHCAGSMASVLASLFEARDMLGRLGYTWSCDEEGVTWRPMTDKERKAFYEGLEAIETS